MAELVWEFASVAALELFYICCHSKSLTWVGVISSGLQTAAGCDVVEGEKEADGDQRSRAPVSGGVPTADQSRDISWFYVSVDVT